MIMNMSVVAFATFLCLVSRFIISFQRRNANLVFGNWPLKHEDTKVKIATFSSGTFSSGTKSSRFHLLTHHPWSSGAQRPWTIPG